MKIKRKSTITLIVIASLILLLGLWHTARMMGVKYWMEDYLEKKYGKEFVVDKVGYQFSYYGDGLYLKGIAHPKDDPSLKFDIVRDSKGGVFRKYPIYGEIYRRVLWNKQKREEIKSILGTNLVEVDIAATYDRKELFGKTINVDKAEQQFKKRIDMYITYGLLIDFNDFNRRIGEFNNFTEGNLSKEQAENLYNIIKKLKNRNYSTIKLDIRYFNSKYENKINKNSKWYLYATDLDFYDLPSSEKGTLLCSFEIGDINRINKPEDVERFIDLREGYIYQDNSKD